jgi:hypothetical protein
MRRSEHDRFAPRERACADPQPASSEVVPSRHPRGRSADARVDALARARSASGEVRGGDSHSGEGRERSRYVNARRGSRNSRSGSSLCVSASTHSTSTPAAAARRRACSNSSGVTSQPTTVAPRSAAGIATLPPLPVPTSSRSVPGSTPIRSSTRAPTGSTAGRSYPNHPTPMWPALADATPPQHPSTDATPTVTEPARRNLSAMRNCTCVLRPSRTICGG